MMVSQLQAKYSTPTTMLGLVLDPIGEPLQVVVFALLAVQMLPIRRKPITHPQPQAETLLLASRCLCGEGVSCALAA